MGLDNQNVHGADELIRRLHEAQEYMKQDVKTVIGAEAVKHFNQGFLNEGFTDTTLEKWKPRATKRKGSTDNQKVLSQTKVLKDSIRHRIEGDTVIISTDIKYAQIHNEGFEGPETVPAHARKGTKGVKEHTRNMKMPKRQFMGPSEEMNKKITDKIVRDLDKKLNS